MKSSVEVSEYRSHVTDARMVEVIARGGSRRERGAAIGAAVRGKNLRRVHLSRSEHYGFLEATFATYRED